MALPSANISKTITGRGSIGIIFHIPDPDNEDDHQYGELEVQVRYSDNTVAQKKYDLLMRLKDDKAGKDTHLPALISLRNYILTRIDDEILGI